MRASVDFAAEIARSDRGWSTVARAVETPTMLNLDVAREDGRGPIVVEIDDADVVRR